MRLIAALNRRYDNVPEPWRLLLAIALFMLGIIPLAGIGIARFHWLPLAGCAWLGAVFAARAAWKLGWAR